MRSNELTVTHKYQNLKNNGTTARCELVQETPTLPQTIME